MKENEKLRLGSKAQRLLLYTLPFMILLALALTVFVAQADAVTLLNQRESILLLPITRKRERRKILKTISSAYIRRA